MTEKPNQTRDEVLLRILKTPPTPDRALGQRVKSKPPKAADAEESAHSAMDKRSKLKRR
jgi:hypothetical protein